MDQKHAMELAKVVMAVPYPCRVMAVKIKEECVGPLALEYCEIQYPKNPDVLNVMAAIRVGDIYIRGARVIING